MQEDRLIVLSKRKCKESDLVVMGLNSQGSKVGLYARGALRSKKRFGGGLLEPFNYLEVSYDQAGHKKGFKSELRSLSEARLIYGFPTLRENWDRLQLGFYFLRTIERVSWHEDLDSEGLFDLLGNSLKSLEKSEALEKLRLHFDLKLLSQSGVLPFMDGAKAYLEKPVAEHSQVSLPLAEETQLRLSTNVSLSQLFF